MRKTIFIHKFVFVALLVIGLAPLSLFADTVKMKDGTQHDGKITYEGSDIVKIEIAVSASIKETKILPRGDIAEIVKDAPDDVAFAKLKGLVPTASLMSANAYKTALETGPEAFLKDFPDSKHKAAVEEIKKTLAEELDKVERGNIKIEQDWYSPQDQINFKTLIASRVSLLRMQNYTKQGNYNGYIAALREYEKIEENYFGTPAYPAALSAAQKIVPTLGKQLQTMLRDVEYRNAEWEKNKAQMDEASRAQVEAARMREEETYKANLAADKKAGIKWVRLNPRSKPSIESYLKLAAAEMPKLKTYDIEKLNAQAKQLVEIDKMVAANQLDRAKVLLDKAAAMNLLPGDDTASSSSSKKRRSSSSRSRSRKKGAKSYVGALYQKIDEKVQERTLLEKAAEAAKASESLTGTLKTSENKDEAGEEGKEGGDDEAMADKASEGDPDLFAALAQADAKKKDEDDKKKSSKSKSRKKSSSRSDDDDDDDDKEKRPPVDSGGGINFMYVVWGICGLLLLAVAALKFLGIGGKKDDDD